MSRQAQGTGLVCTPPSAADTAFISWMYVSCTKTASNALASGSCSYTLPATLAAGNYELRLFSNDSYTRLATSKSFSVALVAMTPILNVSPTAVAAGGMVTATWSGIVAPSSRDWIGLYAPSAADSNFISWMYVSCTKTASNALASGSCSYSLPATLAAGNYELRLFSNDSFTRLATSTSLSVPTTPISNVSSPTVAAPTISPNGGSYTGSMTVTMQTATSGASIYYTTNGSTPTQSSTLYTGGMTLTSSATVKAKAFKSGYNSSAEANASFTFTAPGIASGVTRYVDGQMSGNCTSGNYSIANRNCTGSDGNAYGTATGLQAAANVSTGGDTIYVRSFLGVYTGSGSYNSVANISGSSAAKRLRIFGCPAGVCASAERPIVRSFYSSSFLHIKDLIVDGGNTRNSSMRDVGGVNFSSRLENLEIRNMGEQGLAGSTCCELINLNVHNNGFNADLCSPSVPFGEGDGQCHGAYIGDGNLIDGGEYHHNRGYGIHCYTSCSNVTIRNLRVHHNRSVGIIMGYNGSNSQIYNVIVDNNGATVNGLAGFKAYGLWMAMDGLVADNITAYNNSSIDVISSNHANHVLKDSIAIPNGIGTRGLFSGDGGFTALTNNITSGSASSLFVDASNANFQTTSTANGAGANVSALYP